MSFLKGLVNLAVFTILIPVTVVISFVALLSILGGGKGGMIQFWWNVIFPF